MPELIVPKVMSQATIRVDPEHITLDRIDKSRANMLIKIEESQFVASELATPCGIPKNKSNVSAVNRTLIDKSGQSIILRTSSYTLRGRNFPRVVAQLFLPFSAIPSTRYLRRHQGYPLYAPLHLVAILVHTYKSFSNKFLYTGNIKKSPCKA